MHEVPLLSAVSAVTELFVTAAVFYVLWAAIVRDEFKTRLLAAALGYEVLVNIAYMAYRLLTHTEPGHHPGWMVGLLALHGILSLLMFLALVAFAVLAFRAHGRGRNLFRERLAATHAFVALWLAALLSGEAVFLLEYVGHY